MKTPTLASPPRGFALVITLLLMIILTVVAVGLLSLSTISIRTSGQAQAMATARSNARLALMMALGDLQKSLGPDCAVTANSDILFAPDSPTPPTPPNDDKFNISGVWKSWDFDPNSSTPLKYAEQKTQKYDPQKKDGRFLRWLVSSPNPTDTQEHEFVTTAWPKNTGVGLVKSGSLGSNTNSQAKAFAGLVPVTVGKSKGAYAWHVADESLKARINIYRDPSQNTTYAQKRALLAGHRPDPSVMTGADGTSPSFLPTDLISTEFKKAKDQSNKLLGLNQFELLDQATKNKVWQFRNEMTPYSLGLLTDVRRGGLKQDLSSVFELDGTLPVEFSSKRLYATTHGLTGVSDPYWSTLAGYYNSFRTMTALETNPKLALPVPTNLAVDPLTRNPSLVTDNPSKTYFPGPVIAKVEMVFSLVTREVASSYLGRWGPEDDMNKFDDTVNLIFTPQITLHNPYNVNVSFQKMTVTIVNVPVAFKFTLLTSGGGGQSQSVNPIDFESLNEWNQVKTTVGDKKFVLQIANWSKPIPGDMGLSGSIVMKPGEVVVCTPYLNPAGTFLKDSRSDEINDVFDWRNKLTSTGSGSGTGPGIKMKPGFTRGLGFEINNVTPSCRSSTTPPGASSNWWMLMLRDPIRPRTPIQPDPYRMNDMNPSNGHPNDRYFVEYRAQLPKWWTGEPGTTPTYAAPSFEVSATLQPTGGTATIDYAKLKFDYGDDATLKTFFNNRTYRCPADPTEYLTGAETFVAATTSISAQAKVLPFAVFSAYARTTNGGVYETGKRSKSGVDSTQVNLLKDGSIAGKPFLFHNPSRAVVTMNLAKDKPGIQPYELNLQPFLSRGDYENYMSVDGNRVPALTGNTTDRGIKSGSYLEIPTGPMQTIADFRRSNALTSSFLPQFVQPVGNSSLHPLMSPDKVIEINSSISATPLIDHSVLANHALYDRFYFSTFATRGSEKPDAVFEKFMNDTTPLPSQAFLPYRPNGQSTSDAKAALFSSGKPKDNSYKTAAEYQLLQNPFNVNSTSVQAWKAVLAAMNKSEVATLWAKNAVLEAKVSPRVPILGMSLLNGGRIGGPAVGAKIDDAKTNEWNGYRDLSDVQLTRLATEIVKQIHQRGPFLSMSEFVNRQIGPISDLSLSGALEKAIADSEINKDFLSGSVTELKEEHFTNAALYNYKTPKATIGNPAAGAPGWVSQGDLLRILEPAAMVRSDTFVIRVYGEAKDGSGNPVKAYAEAVVQRVPEYVDPIDRPSLNAYDQTTPSNIISSASIINKTFGRRINVVSFRWLTNSEI
jgi:type II secretory pathway pseudopilin PulG